MFIRFISHYPKLLFTTTSMLSFGIPKNASAEVKERNLRSVIKDKNEEDRIRVIEEYKYNISKAYPYLAGKITDPSILEQLDYIRIMYTQPLTAERRIRLRKTILQMIESGKLSEEACDGLILLLKNYRAL